MKSKQVTLLFLQSDNHILLAMKKRGFGAGRWNGVGGKIEPGETIEAATIRECQEEIGVTPLALQKVAHLSFTFPDGTEGFHAHTYVTRSWDGEPIETEEMAPQWFHLDQIPYDEMWSDDRYWLPHVLAGKKFNAHFAFDQNDQVLHDYTTINFVDAPD